MRVLDDQASLVLPIDARQAPGRQAAAVEQVREHAAGHHRRQLIGVADEHDARVGSDRLDELVRQRHVEHRQLVDDDQVGLERPLLVVREPVLERVVAEQPVDRLRLAAGRLCESLGRAAGGGGERDLRAGALGELHDEAHDRRLADAGAAGQQRDARGEQAEHGFALQRVQLDAHAAFGIGELALARQRACPAAFGRDEPRHVARERALAGVQHRRVDESRAEARLGLLHELAPGDELVEAALEVRGGHLAAQQAIRGAQQFLARQARVSVRLGLLLREQHSGPRALHRVARHAEALSRAVGDLEADAADAVGEPIGILAQQRLAVGAVALEHRLDLPRTQAEPVQERARPVRGEFAAHALDEFRPHVGAQPGDARQLRRIVTDGLERALSQAADDAAGQHLPDAWERTRRQVADETVGIARRQHAGGLELELSAVLAAVRPAAEQADAQALEGFGQRTHGGDPCTEQVAGKRLWILVTFFRSDL